MVSQILLLPLILAAAIQTAFPEQQLVTREAWVMGTRLRVSIDTSFFEDTGSFSAPTPHETSAPHETSPETLSPTAAEMTEAILREVERLDGLLSTWNPASEMGRANSAPVGFPAALSRETAEILGEALAWTHQTRGAFDPTVGALVDAWALRGEGAIPDPEALAAARAASGPAQFELRLIPEQESGDSQVPNPALVRHSSGAWIDTGAFGKGAALKAVADIPRKTGTRALIDLGGQVWASAPASHPWTVSVAHPLHRKKGIIPLSLHDVSVATSGISERWVEVAGRRLGHILDPRSGLPVPAWGTVAVVSPDPMEADILATALYVMGPEAGMAWARRHPVVSALFLEVCRERVRATWTRAMESWFAEFPEPGAVQGSIIPELNEKADGRRCPLNQEADRRSRRLNGGPDHEGPAVHEEVDNKGAAINEEADQRGAASH